MATFEFITDVVSVRPSFRAASVALPLVQVHGTPPDHKYFQCICTNHLLKTLIVEDRFIQVHGSVAKALCNTDILKQLKQLKDDAWNRHTEAIVGINIRQKSKWRAKILMFPATVAITAPVISAVESKTLTVQLTPPNNGLVMLLTSEALVYLRDAVSAQLQFGGAVVTAHVRTNMSQDDRVDIDEHNLNWSYLKKKYRAAFVPPDVDGIKQPRREYYTESKVRAMTFVRTGVKSEDSDVDRDNEIESPSEQSEAEDGDGAASASTTIR